MFVAGLCTWLWQQYYIAHLAADIPLCMKIVLKHFLKSAVLELDPKIWHCNSRSSDIERNNGIISLEGLELEFIWIWKDPPMPQVQRKKFSV